MSTNENITDPYEYLREQSRLTQWHELPERIINNLNLKVSNKTIGDSFFMAVRVYEGVCNDTNIIIARCDTNGCRDRAEMALIVIEGYGWFRASLDMLKDEWSIKYIESTIEKAKNR